MSFALPDSTKTMTFSEILEIFLYIFFLVLGLTTPMVSLTSSSMAGNGNNTEEHFLSYTLRIASDDSYAESGDFFNTNANKFSNKNCHLFSRDDNKNLYLCKFPFFSTFPIPTCLPIFFG